MNALNDNWSGIDWTQVQRSVTGWQRKVYEESKAGNIGKVRRMQRLIVHSHEAKLLATRRVTQDNTGKATAGVDGIKRLTPAERFAMARSLRVPTAGMPLRRVWIPKRGGKLRPLGIPTIHDRCMQALVKLALEPEWEAHFEPNSYGFRPGRNPHDAVKAVLDDIVKGEKYVLDADISACFDTIDHESLLRKTGLKGRMRAQIKSWLVAGVVDSGTMHATVRGTPQGGVISPLLANIALHGLETHLKRWIRTQPARGGTGKPIGGPQKKSKSIHIIRYADDFVVLHPDREIIIRARGVVQEFLANVGLELSSVKTRLTHTRCLGPTDTAAHGFDGVVGFDFLGFTFKQFDTKHRSAKSSTGARLNYKSLVFPSAKSVNLHQGLLHDVVLVDGKRLKQAGLIKKLNPKIRGWADYFGVSDANTTGHLAKQDYLLYLKLRQWSKRKTGSAKAGYNKYWSKKDGGPLRYRDGELTLENHQSRSRPINGYVKVQAARSPYDGDETYWSERKANTPGLKGTVKSLLARQNGRCKRCGLVFEDDDVMEIDHIIPRRRGGRNKLKNLQLLHRHCHDVKSAHDGANAPIPPHEPHDPS